MKKLFVLAALIASPAAAQTMPTTGNDLVQGATTAMTGTSSTPLIAGIGTKRLYITSVHCNNAGSTATLVEFHDGDGGAILDKLAAGGTYGGDNRTSATPLFWTTGGNGLYVKNATTGASVICQASGYAK